MEVKLNSGVGGVVPPSAHGIKPRHHRTTTDETSFQGYAALNGALEKTPDVRPAAVARAKELANDPKYPPTEAIRRIANLLAMNMDSTVDQ